MPELPEVETTRLGLLPLVKDKKISQVIVRQRRLRYPIAPQFEQHCQSQTIIDIERRSKYLKLNLNKGYILLHLGMSGHLSVLADNTPPQKHDHIDLLLNNKTLIRYTDPRRFGMVNWFDAPEASHPLLKSLAIEPLSRAFNGSYLFKQCQTKSKAIKKVLMDNHIVVGVGNIYAQECLFLTGIHPMQPANKLTITDCQNLAKQIKAVLKKAIKQGGTTLKDFKKVDGKPGYFAQKLFVYGRANQSCLSCQTAIEKCIIDNRTTCFCPSCQVLY